MLKKFISALFLLTALLAPSALAETFDGFTYAVGDGGITITGYENEAAASLDIPAYIDGTPVTAIGPKAFSGQKSLVSVKLPYGVTSVGEAAFSECSALKDINLSAVQTIGSRAFYNCRAIESVDLSGVVSIGREAFRHCAGLNGTLVLPATLAAISDWAFAECVKIDALQIPESVRTIGANAFSRCFEIGELVLPEGVESIGNSAFFYCVGLTSVTLPSTLKSSGENAFEDCNYIEAVNISDISAYINISFQSLESNPVYHSGTLLLDGAPVTSANIPEGAASVKGNLFVNCKSLKSVNIPESVTSIGGSAFYGCSSLAELELPERLTAIGGSAFAYCSSLTSVRLAETVRTVGSDAYQGCYGLESVYIDSMDAYQSISFGNDRANPMYYARSLLLKGGPVTQYKIPEGTTEIKDRAFYNWTALESVVIPSTVTSIGEAAFYGCTSLKELTLPDGLRTIGAEAFCGCSGMKKINLPESVESIGGSAFASCYGLERVDITDLGVFLNYAFADCGANPMNCAKDLYLNGEPVTEVTADGDSIGDFAFYNWRTLKKVVISESVASIGEAAFYCCDGLTELELPQGLKSVGDFAFAGCSGLTEISLPRGISKLAPSAFAFCSSLTSAELPDGLETIGEAAFLGCSSLGSIELPSGVTLIDLAAFSGCTGIKEVRISDLEAFMNISFGDRYNYGTSVSNPLFYAQRLILDGEPLSEITVPDGVTEIKDYVFFGWKGLKSVKLHDGITRIGSYAFYNCSNLTDIALPPSVTEIRVRAFYGCSGLKEITVPEGATLGRGSFQGCTGLADIKLPSVSSVGDTMFYGCTGLTSITVPRSVAAVNISAFHGCDSLQTVNYIGTAEDWADIVIMDDNDCLRNAKVRPLVPAKAVLTLGWDGADFTINAASEGALSLEITPEDAEAPVTVDIKAGDGGLAVSPSDANRIYTVAGVYGEFKGQAESESVYSLVAKAVAGFGYGGRIEASQLERATEVLNHGGIYITRGGDGALVLNDEAALLMTLDPEKGTVTLNDRAVRAGLRFAEGVRFAVDGGEAAQAVVTDEKTVTIYGLDAMSAESVHLDAVRLAFGPTDTAEEIQEVNHEK